MIGQPRILQMVTCPEDRGDPAYQGRIFHVDQQVSHNHRGDPFYWTVVRHPRGTKHVWPSNRLG